MLKRILVIGVISASAAVFGCGDSGATPPAPLAPSVVASRTSGVAPLAVFFDATGTTSPVTTRPFHEIEYRWDFGDPGSGTWTSTPNMPNLSRNAAMGPVAAHVFETPGTYTVAMTALDGTNTASCSVRITVANPDVVFAGANTICFSTSGTFTGCPAGAQQIPTSSFATVVTHAAPLRRLLLRRGETWSAATSANLVQTGPGILGAFGPGASPIIRATGNVNILQISSGSTPALKDWRVMDLEFDGLSGNNVEAVMANGGADQITLLRLNAHNLASGIDFPISVLDYWNANGSPGHHTWDQLAVIDSTITTVINSGCSAYISGTRLSFLGNVADDSIAGEHILRTPYIGKGVISNNTLSRPRATKHVLKMHGPNFGSAGVAGGGPTEKVVVSDNKFVGGNDDWTVALGPQNAQVDERVRDILVERNWFKAGATTQVGLVIFAAETTVRNNIIDTTGAKAHHCIAVSRRGIEPASTQVRVLNNTCYSADTSVATNFGAVVLQPPASFITVKNNLAYAPNATSPMLLQNLGATDVTASNNSSDSQVKNTSSPFAVSAPSAPADFKIHTGSYAKRGGTPVPIFSGFFRVATPRNGNLNIGAAEEP